MYDLMEKTKMMKVITNSNESEAKSDALKIAVHDGCFHLDELLAVALVQMAKPHSDIEVYRVPHKTSEFENFDMVIDVGGKYDCVKYFDHHQPEAKDLCDVNGVKYSACGMIFNRYAADITQEFFPNNMESQIALRRKFLEVLEPIEIGDNDTSVLEEGDNRQWKTVTLPEVVRTFNYKDFYDAENQAEKFEAAYNIVDTWLHQWFTSTASRIPQVIEMRHVIEGASWFMPILQLTKAGPWQESFFDLESEHKDLKDADMKVVVFPGRDPNTFNIQAIPEKFGSKKSRLTAPTKYRNGSCKELRGHEVVFTHASGFMQVIKADSLVDAVEAAKGWFEE
jgi:uncharacterized UPF0160 family protein